MYGRSRVSKINRKREREEVQRDEDGEDLVRERREREGFREMRKGFATGCREKKLSRNFT